MPVEKSSGVIIFRKQGDDIFYLLLHYELGHWDFAKGHIEKGETLEQTAIRETEEETGINDLEFINGFREWFKYFFKYKGENIMKIVTFFLARTETKDIKLSFEHIGYKWLPYEQALGQLTFDNAKNILKKANSFLQN